MMEAVGLMSITRTQVFLENKKSDGCGKFRNVVDEVSRLLSGLNKKGRF